MNAPRDEQGMILINVLMYVAIAAGLVLLLINREELALDRATRSREAARALAVARGGELSALVALRRDAETAPESDYAGEAWGRLAERGAPIEGGRFELAIADAQDRFNINGVRSGDVGASIQFLAIAREVGLTQEQMVAAIQYVRLNGPLTDLTPLRTMGVDPKVAARLERLVTALPGTTTINLNSASAEVLALLFRDPATVARLIAIRDQRGYLTPDDLSRMSVTMPSGADFRSDRYWVRTRVTIGSTRQQIATLIRRRRLADGSAVAEPVERWRNAAVPPAAPPFPTLAGGDAAR